MDNFESRRGITFGQAEGQVALPSQMELGTINPELSARLWHVIYLSLDNSITTRNYSTYWSGDWGVWLREWWVNYKFQPVDEFPSPEKWKDICKKTIYSRDYVVVFDFIQFVAQKSGPNSRLTAAMRHALVSARSAYRLMDDLVVPITSSEQAEALAAALAKARSASPQGPYSHLRQASAALTSGLWANAVQQSIHAVEGAAKSVEPTADTLGPALSKMQAAGNLPPALKKAFGALYGWTSDEQGVRHALVFEETATVSERDALFMFGACASFVAYILSSN